MYHAYMLYYFYLVVSNHMLHCSIVSIIAIPRHFPVFAYKDPIESPLYTYIYIIYNKLNSLRLLP
jgi:hypothetical protein